MIPRADERRSCVRGFFPYTVKYRILTSDKHGETRNDAGQVSGVGRDKFKTSAMFADINGITPVHDDRIMNFLVHLDEKLDLILAFLSEPRTHDPMLKEGVGVDISASGMSFMADQLVELEQEIQAQIILSKLPFVRIDVTGRVVRTTPVSKEKEKLYHLGVEFVDIEADDREKIVACVFQKQRRSIRKQRGLSADQRKV